MSSDALPSDGEPLVGGVRLPPGRRVSAAYGQSGPVAWITDAPVPDAGEVWLSLEHAAARTGLRPLLHVVYEDSGDYQPAGDYVRPCAVSEVDDLAALSLLTRGWTSGLMTDDLIDRAALGIEDWMEDEERSDAARRHHPFGEEFPGLAPGTTEALAQDRLRQGLDALGPAYVCLVAASRPADILPVIGWSVTDLYETPLPIAAVLRSWEGRFGARLLEVGPSATLRVLVERPPRTLEAATAIAAEHVSFCSAWIDPDSGEAFTTVSEIAPRLIDAPTWTFWWD
jgi:hypothetical protein